MSRYEHFFTQATLATLLAFAAPALLHAEAYNVTLGSGDRDVTIVVGDSLNLTAGVAGTARAFQGSGTIGSPFPVHVGDHQSFTFPTAGSYSGTISDASGAALSRITIQVVSTTLSSKAIADQVGFTRTVAVTVAPAGAVISFAPLDASVLTVSQQVIAGTSATFNVKVLARGTPVVIAQIMSPGGVRTIASRAVDDFTLETSALADTVIDNQSGIGRTHLVIRPFIPELEVDFSMFAHSSTFHGGATTIKTFTSSDFIRSFDPVTHEQIGTYYLELDVPPGESRYCFHVQPFQDDPIAIGDSGGVNGHACKVDVDVLILCALEEQPLVMTARVTNEGLHPVTIMRKAGATKAGANALFTKPQTDPDDVRWGNGKLKFDCSKTEPQKAMNVKGADHCEKYDVQIEDTLFTDRIQVTNRIKLEIRLASSETWSPQAEFDKSDALTRIAGALLGTGIAGLGSNKGSHLGNNIEFVATLCPDSPPLDNQWSIQQDTVGKVWFYEPTNAVGSRLVLANTMEIPAGQQFGPADQTGNDPIQSDRYDYTFSPSKKIYASDPTGIFMRLLGSFGSDAAVGTIIIQRFNALVWPAFNQIWDADCDPLLPWHNLVAFKKIDRVGKYGTWVRVTTPGTNEAALGFTPNINVTEQEVSTWMP